MAKSSQPTQRVKRVQLSGSVSAVEFESYGGQYLVKNYSGGDIYVSFEDTVSEDKSIKISKGYGQVCVINERDGLNGQAKAKTIYLKGTGEVEVQQLWY